ncbi:MAG: efflux RND transporter periplasmic adaptor subunit [Candidatus Aminicenantes bacterium]|nr:efflux RND transporter periplasmic adaptor subunit [Candidatus Aminicenantes bacterium]
MNTKAFVILVILFFIFSAACGTKSRRHEQATAQDIPSAQSAEQDRPGTPPGRGRLHDQDLQPPGRGLGRQAAGGGFRRGWTLSTAVELSAEETRAIEIETVVAAYKPISSQLPAMGKVLAHPLRKAIVSYAFPARIAKIHVRPGDWVKEGLELVTLQSEEVGEAKSAYYKAIADYELAKQNSEREKRLFDRGVGAQKNMLTTEAELKVAEASLNAAEKKLHVLGFTEAQVKEISERHQVNPVITLFSPISGKVVQNNAVLGGMIDQATEILTIMDPSLLCVDAEIYERDIAKIRNGQPVDVSVPAYPEEKFQGKICYIGDVLKEDTRTVTVRTEVENRGNKLKPGMFANITIFLNHQTQALVLPPAAILDDKDDKMVFIKRGHQFFPRLVETGIRDKDAVEIIAGVEAGDEVVTKGNFQLKSKLYDETLKKAGIH